jgi:kynurenine 3-monooxygenase
MRFFHDQFSDAVALMPTLVEDYFSNPVGSLVTVRCGPWYLEDKVILLGDAAHAVVPFYGQGMNAAFEDVLVLCELMEAHGAERARAFREFYARRKPDVDALADLAIENFVEMRDHTGKRSFLIRKKAEAALHKLFPTLYLPMYTMVTFTRMRYSEALTRARRQHGVVRAVGVLLLVTAMLIVAALVRTT